MDSTTTSPLLQAQDLHFAYHGRALFDGWSGTIASGVTLMQGGDGRGKSTLLRLFAGALAASRGRLAIAGTALDRDPAGYRAQLFWTEARNEAFDELTPPQYFDTIRARHPAFDETWMARLVEGLGLEAHLHKQLFMLSTGSKRKVWLAAAFAARATVTLIDEPFAALDGPSIAFVTGLLQEAAREPARAIVIADYGAPAGVPLSTLINLGD